MPNIAGIWNPNLTKEELSARNAVQAKRIGYRHAHYAEYRLLQPGIAMVHLDHGILENGPQPVVIGSLSLMLDGEINNLPELRRHYGRELPLDSAPAAELCLRLIAHYGPEIVKEFSGLFVLVIHDHEKRTLTLISDRYGYRSMYYLRRGSSFLFGTELKAIAAVDPAPRALDEVGLLEFFAYGTHMRENTWLDGYCRLEPASILTLNNKSLSLRKYWNYHYEEKSEKLDQMSYVSRFAVLLDRAVERCLRSEQHRIGIFLSGGYDSRSVAASIRPEHLPLPAFCFGHRDSRDIRYAALLAQKLGLEYHGVYDEDDNAYLLDNCRKIIWRTEGMSLFSHTTSIRYHNLIKSKMDIFLTGFLGEFQGSHTWPGLLLARNRKSAREEIFTRMLGGRLPQLSRIFTRSYLARNLPQIRRHFDESLDTLNDEHPLNLADAFNLTFLQPRSTGQASSVDRHILEMRAPHMDWELVQFLMSIPVYARLEQRIYKQVIAYAFPSIRNIPCANSGKPIDPHFFREYLSMVARYLFVKILSPIRKTLGSRPSLGREPRNLAQAFRAEPGLRDNIFQKLLFGSLYPTSVFNKEGLEAVFSEHYGAKANHEQTLDKIITFGIAAQYFLHDDLSQAPDDFYAK